MGRLACNSSIEWLSVTKFTDLPAGNLYPTIRYSKATSNKYNYSQYDHCFVCNTGYVELKKALDDQ